MPLPLRPHHHHRDAVATAPRRCRLSTTATSSSPHHTGLDLKRLRHTPSSTAASWTSARYFLQQKVSFSIDLLLGDPKSSNSVHAGTRRCRSSRRTRTCAYSRPTRSQCSPVSTSYPPTARTTRSTRTEAPRSVGPSPVRASVLMDGARAALEARDNEVPGVLDRQDRRRLLLHDPVINPIVASGLHRGAVQPCSSRAAPAWRGPSAAGATPARSIFLKDTGQLPGINK